ncbi:hypothetical protein DOS77_00010, partial [Staphylococcus felis]
MERAGQSPAQVRAAGPWSTGRTPRSPVEHQPDRMPRPLAPLATSLPTILTVPEGRAAGLSRARLRAPDLA